MSKKAAFLDTMLFLHFRSLDSIDWLSLLGSYEVELVLAPVVCRQLDRHKDQHPMPGLRRRARSSVQRLRAWLGASATAVVRQGVTLRLVDTDPGIDFGTHNLSREVEDDQLIATAIEYQRTNGQEVFVVTDDFLLAAKARKAGFGVVVPSDSDRLPEASSEEAKKLKKLEAENQRLKGRRPRLVVSFLSGADHEKVELKPLGPLSIEAKEQELTELGKRYPLRSIAIDAPQSPGQDPGRASVVLGGIALTQFAVSLKREEDLRYNNKLEDYYKEYTQYLEWEHEHRQMLSTSVTFSLQVANAGTAVARDIDLVVRAKVPVRIYKEHDKSLMGPPVPSPPDGKPRPWDLWLPSRLVPPIRALEPAAVSVDVENFANDFEISAHIRKLKHTQREHLGPFVVVFESASDVRPFQLSYSLNSEDLAENLEGTLHLVVSIAQ